MALVKKIGHKMQGERNETRGNCLIEGECEQDKRLQKDYKQNSAYCQCRRRPAWQWQAWLLVSDTVATGHAARHHQHHHQHPFALSLSLLA
jgi:hypothetical protein